jgi:membrane protein implicated in regulation of membrane protease activity
MPLGPAWKYTLLQVPDTVVAFAAIAGLRAWLDLPLWLALAAAAGWVIKEIALYPFVRDSLREGPDRLGAGRLIGQQGIAQEPIDPAGYVRVAGELWQAEQPRGLPAIARHERVRVRAVRGLTLLVERDA